MSPQHRAGDIERLYPLALIALTKPHYEFIIRLKPEEHIHPQSNGKSGHFICPPVPLSVCRILNPVSLQ